MIVPIETIRAKIYLLRGQKVLLDSDLAALYGVETKRLNEQVRRNSKRFPDDFMFQLTVQEVGNLKSQFAATSSAHGGRRTLPYVFTEQGIAMLSSVLNSDRAIEVNIAIMRAFVQMRELAGSSRELTRRLDELERKYEGHDRQLLMVFDAIRELVAPPERKKRKIGFGGE